MIINRKYRNCPPYDTVQPCYNCTNFNQCDIIIYESSYADILFNEKLWRTTLEIEGLKAELKTVRKDLEVGLKTLNKINKNDLTNKKCLSCVYKYRHEKIHLINCKLFTINQTSKKAKSYIVGGCDYYRKMELNEYYSGMNIGEILEKQEQLNKQLKVKQKELFEIKKRLRRKVRRHISTQVQNEIQDGTIENG